jgi:hypothetical protein
MLPQAEKHHQSAQMFEFAAGLQVEAADLRYSTLFSHFLFRFSQA